ncbi:MAG TPA: hypothetical protein VM324_16665 [Egibacteraceae bacterium]|nr:hypothetical protein [Egibacteraceae bacterium]
MVPRDRDRTTVRRALAAGAAVWLAVGTVLVTIVVRAGGDGAAGLAAVFLALVSGAVVASGWLLLAAALDLLAGEPPGRRRVLWTVGVLLFTFSSPLLVVAAQAAR